MAQPHTQPPENGPTFESSGLIISSPNSAGVAKLNTEVELATMRQMMETLFNRVETLQQNQAIQLAGVHDRLDAVELELPLIQEQSALRIRDLESRMSAEIEEATRSAVDDAKAGLQQEVEGRFGSLATQLESQRKELTEMRESKKLAESKLDRVVRDIERLCGTLGARPSEEAFRQVADAPSSAFRSRIAEHIRRAAVEAAPDESNPLIAGPLMKKPEGAPKESPVAGPVEVRKGTPGANSSPSASVAAVSTAATPTKATAADHTVPGFDDWKRQFMQDGEPQNPTMVSEAQKKIKLAVCPRCFSERIRPASPSRLDALFRLTGMSPQRCRSCSHRFYKRGGVSPEQAVDEENMTSRTEEVLESR